MTKSEALVQDRYARLPIQLGPLAPRLASAIGDGAWTAVSVRIGAWAPVVVFLIGLFVPRTWPGALAVYTESPLFLEVAAVLSILSGALGVALLAGNGLREALSHDVASGLNAVIHVGAGQFVVWLLLAVLVVMLPQLAHLISEAGVVRMRFLGNRHLRALTRSLLLAAIYPCLVLLWCQATTVLVRPVFAWSGDSPSLEALQGAQTWWPWLASAAASGAFLRGLLEGVVAPRIRRNADGAALGTAHVAAAEQSEDGVRSLAPEVVRVAMAVAVMTLLLSGTFTSATDALVAAVVIGLLAMLNRGLGGWLTGRWAIRVRRVPGVVRVAGALGAGYLLAFQALHFEWGTTVLRSMMTGTLLTLTLFFVLFPVTKPPRVVSLRRRP